MIILSPGPSLKIPALPPSLRPSKALLKVPGFLQINHHKDSEKYQQKSKNIKVIR